MDLPDRSEREGIFRIHLGLRKQQSEEFDIARLAEASEGFSGAEIEQVVIASLYRSLHVKQRPDTDLILVEIGDTIPLSVARREDIERLRALARDRFVSVR